MSAHLARSDFFSELEARLCAQLSERMLDLVAVRAGVRVLDVGSGRGEPALRAAQRVGASGAVLGIDVAAASLDVARAKAREAHLDHLELRLLDVESLTERARFDVATSRWCLMYLREPARALAAIHRALVPGGRLVAAVWAEPERVSWATVPRAVTSRFATLPPTSAFRYATSAQSAPDFTAAGFVIEHEEEHEVAVVEAADGAGIVEWTKVVLDRLAQLVPPEQGPAWEAALARAAEAHRDGAVVRLGGVTRLIVARRA